MIFRCSGIPSFTTCQCDACLYLVVDGCLIFFQFSSKYCCLCIFANFRDDNVSNNNFLVDFVERDLLEWLAGLEACCKTWTGPWIGLVNHGLDL